MRERFLRAWPAAVLLCLAPAACGRNLDLGSDVIWSANHEVGTFDQWIEAPGGKANASPAPNSVEISSEHVHRGAFAAKLTINAGPDGVQANSGLSRFGILPTEAYYSAWYFLPRTVVVGVFWVIFKIRMREVVDDPTTEAELYDLDLTSLPGGEMGLRLYDHRVGDVALLDPNVAVPIGRWFQIEAFYRNAPDATGRVTYWLDGRMVADVTGRPTGPTPWVQWVAGNIAQNLTPSTQEIYIDDAAISLVRVGPEGTIGP